MYNLSNEDIEFLKTYNIENFKRPSLTADIVVFSTIKEQLNDNKRIDPYHLNVLLVKRTNAPFRNMWALPGGFCKPDEDVEETASRVLKTETNVKNVHNLFPVGVFGQKDRDPRGWIISNVFSTTLKNSDVARTNSDLWESRWCKVRVIHYSDAYSQMFLTIDSKEYEMVINKTVDPVTHKKNYVLTGDNPLAFDHSLILLESILNLREKTMANPLLVKEFLPTTFTFIDFQHVLEESCGTNFEVSNFRRDFSKYVSKTGEKTKSGRRNAELYKFN